MVWNSFGREVLFSSLVYSKLFSQVRLETLTDGEFGWGGTSVKR